MPAFQRAFAEGARAVELDVRTCGSGRVVVFHDESLGRMTAKRDVRDVSQVPFGELVRIDIGGGAHIPELAEVLGWARANGVAVNVEMKHEVPSRAELARATAQVLRDARADVLLSSFDPLLLAMAAAFGAHAPRALLTHEGQDRWAGALQEAVRPPFVQALHLERTQVGSGVARYARRGLRLGAWTVNDPVEARKLLDLGVASIITDGPGAMIASLNRT
jgi:glycerophosphoryl diester phosphodiesterase